MNKIIFGLLLMIGCSSIALNGMEKTAVQKDERILYLTKSIWQLDNAVAPNSPLSKRAKKYLSEFKKQLEDLLKTLQEAKPSESLLNDDFSRLFLADSKFFSEVFVPWLINEAKRHGHGSIYALTTPEALCMCAIEVKNKQVVFECLASTLCDKFGDSIPALNSVELLKWVVPFVTFSQMPLIKKLKVTHPAQST